jgi:hypothetical protein
METDWRSLLPFPYQYPYTQRARPPRRAYHQSQIYREREEIQTDTEKKNGRQRQGLRRDKENVIYRRQPKTILYALVLQILMLPLILPLDTVHTHYCKCGGGMGAQVYQNLNTLYLFRFR